MKTNKIFITSILAMVFVLGGTLKIAKADGGIFYPPDYYAAETTQKAFIYYANQTENMVVLTKFQGNAKDFVWVIPTPSKPEINKGSVDLFNNLANITKTTDTGIVYNQTFSLSSGSKSASVEVISEKTVDVYDTAVLKATNVNALAQWLSANGYSFPKDQSQNLKSYVDSGWYFAIAKIKPDIINSTDITAQLNEGTLTPLRLTFPTNKIIYPMRLTGIALTNAALAKPNIPSSLAPEKSQTLSPSVIPITLYILSDYKTEQSLLTTSWSNWIGKANIKSINNNLGGNIISGDKLYLTKMSKSVDIKDINDDFVITTANNNDVYPTPVYKTASFWLGNVWFYFLVFIISIYNPLSFVFFIFLILQWYVRRRWLYIIGSVYQLIICLILPLIGLTIILENSADLTSLWWQDGFIGGLISASILEILAIYITIKMIKRYKIIFSK